MIFNFDLSRLERVNRESLLKMLNVIQLENKREIIVKAVELPFVFLVLVDDGIVLLKGSPCRESDCPGCLNSNPNPNPNLNPNRNPNPNSNRNRRRKYGRKRNRSKRSRLSLRLGYRTVEPPRTGDRLGLGLL